MAGKIIGPVTPTEGDTIWSLKVSSSGAEEDVSSEWELEASDDMTTSGGAERGFGDFKKALQIVRGREDSSSS